MRGIFVGFRDWARGYSKADIESLQKKLWASEHRTATDGIIWLTEREMKALSDNPTRFIRERAVIGL